MSGIAALLILAALSAAFGVVYMPIAERFIPALASPYAKVDLRKRFAAAAIDGFVVLTGIVSWLALGAPVLLFAAAVYVALRDSLFAPGQSVGKFFAGVHVIHVGTGRRCTRLRSVARNALFLVPGLNLVALALESRRIIRDPQGQRLGDLLAGTQVVEGFGARELVEDLQRDLAATGARSRRRATANRDAASVALLSIV